MCEVGEWKGKGKKTTCKRFLSMVENGGQLEMTNKMLETTALQPRVHRSLMGSTVMLRASVRMWTPS